MNQLATIGHNNPPASIDEVMAPFGDVIAETDNWLDGTPVETEAQMNAVDALIRSIKEAEKAAADGKEAEYRPYKAAGDAVSARWKPTITDLEIRRRGLLGLVDPFKRKLAAQKEAARLEAERLAWEAGRVAREAAAAADATDIAAMRAAEDARHVAEVAQTAANAAKKDTVKGLRLTWFHEVTSTSELLRWINANDRADLDAYCHDYARRKREDGIERPGMRAWQERVAS